MAIDPNCPKRERILAHRGHALVTGGPGSGKTTLALRKAVRHLEGALGPGQRVLFLSFSRAAVARVLDAANREVPEGVIERVSVQTFHAFFWSLLKTHGYLLGYPRRLSLLLPQDEKALSGGIGHRDPGWAAWVDERERLFLEEGRVAFDLFAPNTAQLLLRSGHIRHLVGQAYPLIIVDEAQDTGTHAWQCIELLAQETHVLCLADLDQQIYDGFLPGVGPERVAAIRDALEPLEVDLGDDNGRSPDTEILAFANDILTNHPRGAPYLGVEKIDYNPKTVDWNTLLRRSFGVILKEAERVGRAVPASIAILTDTTRNALRVSNALNAIDGKGGKAIRHKLHFDEAEALLTARLAAFLLEPQHAKNPEFDVATAIELLAQAKRSTGKGRAAVAEMLGRAQQLRSGKVPAVNLVKAIRAVLDILREAKFSGDPAADWGRVKAALRATRQAELVRAAQQLDFMVAFGRGHRIAQGLSAVWLREGVYLHARQVLDAALAQEQILDGMEDSGGIQILNWHKAKGKQFDAVILVRESWFGGSGKPESSFVWRDDVAPYPKSRRLIRVAATRARQHLLILNPIWPACPVLRGHQL